MPQGLQVFRADGSVSVDITNRLAKFIGIVTLDGSAKSGTIVDSNVQDGDLWYMFLAIGQGGHSRKTKVATWESPTISKGNGCIYWSFPNRPVYGQLMYGVY